MDNDKVQSLVQELVDLASHVASQPYCGAVGSRMAALAAELAAAVATPVKPVRTKDGG